MLTCREKNNPPITYLINHKVAEKILNRKVKVVTIDHPFCDFQIKFQYKKQLKKIEKENNEHIEKHTNYYFYY
jgi:hypothetical protein